MASTSSTKPLRIAFTGGYGHHYLRGALDDASLTVAAVAVAGGEDAAEKAAMGRKFAGLRGAAWHDDAVDMLDAFRPTVVNVGGVYTRNAPVIIAALERNIPVVADKPIAGNAEDLAAIARAAEASEAPLITEFDMRNRAAFRAAAEAVRRGEIGKVALATAQKSYRFGESRPDFYRRREDYGSTLVWVGSHGIDAIRYVTGERFATVTGAHGNLTKPDYATMEDHAAALFTLEGGGAGLVHADYLRPAAAATHGDDRLRVAGGKGVLEIRDNRCWLTTHDQPERDITDTVQAPPVHRAMLDAALHGDTSLYSTEHSLELATVLLTARDAADRRETVKVEG